MQDSAEQQRRWHKLREAVHFVCKKYALQTGKLGAVKLQKVIWYFDVKCTRMNRSSFTGATFTKSEFGPCSRDIEAVLRELAASDRVHADTEDHHGTDKARLIGKGATDLSVFSERELRWLDEISSDICDNHTAESVSERSHGPIWRMAACGEPIPFEAAVVPLRRPSPQDIEAIRQALELP
jgi:hypothetical protein